MPTENWRERFIIVMPFHDYIRRVRRFASRVRNSIVALDRLDEVAFSLGWASRAAAHRSRHLALAPSRNGNIGDEAVTESFVALVGEPLAIIDHRKFPVPVVGTASVESVVLPHLLFRAGLRHYRDVWRFGRLVRSALSVSVFGTDVMDGAYSVRESVMRSRCARLAAVRGIPARVLGFSWNGTPAPTALRALHAACDAGAQLMVRDPHSADRLRVAGLTVTDVADLAFADDRLDSTRAAGLRPWAERTRFALVNVSGLIAERLDVDQAAEHTEMVRYLLQRGFDVVLVPHVRTGRYDDLLACRELMSRVAPLLTESDPRVHLVDDLWTPAQIRALADRAAITVTGRMHLGVISLSRAVPVVIVATQGKVSGLLSLFGLEKNLVVPNTGMGGAMVAAIDRTLADLAGVRARLADSLPAVRGLALKNVAGLRVSTRSRQS